MRRGTVPVLLLAGGCAAAPPPPRPHPAAPADDPPPAFVSPARWAYHPGAPSTALASMRLPDGGCVFTAEGGQRWTSAGSKQAGSRPACTGKAEASSSVAAEDLTSVIRRGDGAWIFAGETGTLFEAEGPLGPFTRTVPAPEPFAHVAGDGAVLLGATFDGRILRWDEAGGWRAIPPSPALAGARVFDLAVHGGRALALAFPEALFGSEDGGLTWARVGAPTIGARRLGRTAAGELGAQGLFDLLEWRGGATAALTDRGKHLSDAVLDVDVGRGPSASSVQVGRAALDGDGYFEVTRPENDGDAWLLSRGRIDGPLDTAPLPKSEGCQSLRLGARGRAIVLVCVSSAGDEIQAEVRRSDDAGLTFPATARLVTPDTDQIGVAVAADGAALITGACRSSEGGGCKPGAPILVRMEDGALQAASATAPQLSGAALLPAFSTDGRSAYFLGRRGKDDRISLFVSHDGGASFTPRSIEAPAGVKQPPRAPSADDDDAPSEPEGPETFDVDETSTLRPGDDGTIGIMLQRSRGGSAYVTADDDGRVIEVAAPPDDDTGTPIMAGYGRRVVALSAGAPDGGSPTLWESLDGGVSWEVEPAPELLVREYQRGTPSAACSAAGCVIGDTVTRLGWGGQGDAGASLTTPDQPSPGTQSVLTPLVCDLSATAKWTRIEDVYAAARGEDLLPDARVMMRGRSAWAVLSYDRRTGAMTTTSATLPDGGDGDAIVSARPLLGPRPPGRSAIAISATQLEGFAAVRARLPVDARGALKIGAPLRDLEVAWENYLEGTSGRARVPDAGPLDRDDLPSPTSDELATALLSVTSHGMFVRPHGRVASEIFVDPKGRVERYTPAPWPAQGPAGALDIRADAAAVGGQILDVGLLHGAGPEWEAVMLARLDRAPKTGDTPVPPGTWTRAVEALLPPHAATGPLLARTSWAWSPRSPVGVYAVVADPTRGRAWAHFVGFRGDGGFAPAEAVPTLLDLGDRPRPCSAADRAGTPRIMMPLTTLGGEVLFPGMRHPVLVHEPRPKNAVGVDEPLVLLTGSAVVHGTPASPCVAAWVAEAAARAPMSAIVAGDPSRSWLFRVAGDAPRAAGKRGEPAGPAIEYRPMTCRFDPSARVPDAVWNERGTSRP